MYPNGKTARTDIVFHYFSKNAYENALNRALKKKKQHVAKISYKSLEGDMMNHNIPIGDKWHNSDVMPQEFKHCVFEISIGGEKEILIGFRVDDGIYTKDAAKYACGKRCVTRWRYINQF